MVICLVSIYLLPLNSKERKVDMATAYELDLVNNVEISPGWCPLCNDPWEACLRRDVEDYPEFGDFYDDEDDAEDDLREDES